MKFPKVGVEVATICPAAFVERSELIDVPEMVNDGAEKEDVAIRFPAVTLPEKYPLPVTDKAVNGEVVPMPILPFTVSILKIFVPPAFSNVNAFT